MPAISLMGLSGMTDTELDDLAHSLTRALVDYRMDEYSLGDFLRQYDVSTRQAVAARMIIHGAKETTVTKALIWASQTPTPSRYLFHNRPLTPTWLRTTLGLLSLAGAATGAYHGYKRNDSVGWAIGWAILGSVLPVISIPLSLAQGFGKPK